MRSYFYLLEVCRETVHVLVIGKNGLSLRTKEVVVPNTQDSHNNRQVLVQWGSLEVVIHFMSTAKQFMEVVKANVDGNRQADGRPERVTSTNPVPETEHVLGIDTKGRYLLLIGREGNKVLSYVSLLIINTNISHSRVKSKHRKYWVMFPKIKQ